jgi:nitroimidazol reductase NimA-like FMN-containing flavoprotein (pyridoxamine 5'-phosphate oxidase superfamily)
MFTLGEASTVMSLDELEAAGMVRMDDGEIRDFLRNQKTGVLGLPDEDGPYMIPMSYSYDGESRLYFSFVLGASSRKEELSDRAERARFLVYQATSPFNWRSVVLDGTIAAVTDAEWDDLKEEISVVWRPELFERAEPTRGAQVYEFRVDDRVGIKHTGLPPAMDSVPDDAA